MPHRIEVDTNEVSGVIIVNTNPTTSVIIIYSLQVPRVCWVFTFLFDINNYPDVIYCWGLIKSELEFLVVTMLICCCCADLLLPLENCYRLQV